MPIINITTSQVGLVGVNPSVAYISTSDTIAQITATGYLNKEVANGVNFSLPCIATVSTMATPTSIPAVGWYQVRHVGSNWSLIQQTTSGNAQFDSVQFNTTNSILDSNGVLNTSIQTVASAVNALAIANAATGNNVTLSGTGSDTNIGITLNAKNAGILRFASTSVTPIIIYSGTAQQHSAYFSFANAATTQTITFPDGNFTVASAANAPLSATVTLTAAQVKALYDTPVLLVAAPGAGNLIVIDNILWDIAYGTAQYTAGGVLAAQYGNAVHGADPNASSTIFASILNGVAASSFMFMNAFVGNDSITKGSSINTGVYLSNATADFATGDSTVTLYIRYRVIAPA